MLFRSDSAQGFGCTLEGHHPLHWADVTTTSFFPAKPLGCYGDGGALFTDDDALAGAAREIRVHGQSARYTHTRVGVGGRMDTLQCAVVLAKLERFDWELQRRREIGARYGRLLAPLQARGLGLLAVRPDRDCVWAQYTVFVPERAKVQAALEAPSLYDEALRLMARRGMPMPQSHLERDWTLPYSPSEAVEQAWLAVYRNPQAHWELYQLGEELTDLEDAFRLWRFRHVTTVERVIGFKRGTGGTSGVGYLRRMLDVVLFPEIWRLRTDL